MVGCRQQWMSATGEHRSGTAGTDSKGFVSKVHLQAPGEHVQSGCVVLECMVNYMVPGGGAPDMCILFVTGLKL